MRILIIGGGYSGACFAIQALTKFGGAAPLSITVLEPRAALGQGIAYSSIDPDHRINAPSSGHMALADDISHFHDWFLADGGLQRDPQADHGGLLFPRRIEFGHYMQALIANAQATGKLLHCRDRAIDFSDDGEFLTVRTELGQHLSAERMVIATGHLPSETPSFVDTEAAHHPYFLRSPWAANALADLPRQARVLILGSGLTAADIIASLMRREHQGAIRVVSRRGLRPQPLPPPADQAPLPIWERLKRPIPDFLQNPFGPATVRQLLHALRIRIAECALDGVDWYEPFDDLRDALYQIWPTLNVAEQRRFWRYLRPWYDSYRYRIPPQTATILARAEQTGQLRFEAAQVQAISRAQQTSVFIGRLRTRGSSQIREEQFEAVVNCTGPGQSLLGADPFVEALLASGQARAHASGIGLDVDQQMAAVDIRGQSNRRISVIGPPSAGALGDPIGAVFICAQIDRLLARYFETDESG